MSGVPEIGGRRPIAINVTAGESYWWCACGRSKTQPFCDGSHKKTRDENPADVYHYDDIGRARVKTEY